MITQQMVEVMAAEWAPRGWHVWGPVEGFLWPGGQPARGLPIVYAARPGRTEWAANLAALADKLRAA